MTGGVLLDTNALLWLVADPDRLAPEARERLISDGTRLVVSAASAWEVATKTRSGRLPGGEALVGAWAEAIGGLRAEQIAIDPADAILAGSLDWPHRDPFDRMLVAQARRRHMAVATSDDVILGAALVPTLDIRAGQPIQV